MATILIVEDEPTISFLIEDMAAELGAAEVCHAAGVAEALALIAGRRPDAAILDVNLAGEPVHPLAERLAAIGVPFVFATGYDRRTVLPPRFEAIPTLAKPFSPSELARLLTATLKAA